jgi:hypothetical protein
MNASPLLHEWLTRVHDEEAAHDVRDRVADPVAERLISLTRPLRPHVAIVDGAVVVHTRGGTPFAASAGAVILVRAVGAPGSLATTPVDGLEGWRTVEPWPDDVGFRRGTDELRDLLARACREAAR